MRSAQCILLASLLLTGCDSMNRMQVDNPVMPDAPPRREVARASNANTPPDPNIVQMTYSPAEAGSNELVGSRVVASVNGAPVFESDILDRYQTQLLAAREKMSDIEFGKLKLALIERDLHVHVENQLLVNAMLSTLGPEQQEMLEQQLQKAFSDHVSGMAVDMGVNTQLEVERELAKRGASLDLIRKEFANQSLAVEYLRAKAKVDEKVERGELLAYYRQHLDDYARDAEVKWMHLSIRYGRHGGRDAAEQVLRQAVQELQQGQDFADVARKYSDGPTAKDGGMRDWLKKGSLADEELEEALFSLPNNAVSRVFTDDARFQIVKVVESKPARHVPFEEVQDKIEQTIKAERRSAAFKKVINELRSTATIVTIFDQESANARSATPSAI